MGSGRILELPLPAMRTMDKKSRQAYLAPILASDSARSTRALGALIKHVEKERFGAEMEGAVPFIKLDVYAPPNTVLINHDALTYVLEEWRSM